MTKYWLFQEEYLVILLTAVIVYTKSLKQNYDILYRISQLFQLCKCELESSVL